MARFQVYVTAFLAACFVAQGLPVQEKQDVKLLKELVGILEKKAGQEGQKSQQNLPIPNDRSIFSVEEGHMENNHMKDAVHEAQGIMQDELLSDLDLIANGKKSIINPLPARQIIVDPPASNEDDSGEMPEKSSMDDKTDTDESSEVTVGDNEVPVKEQVEATLRHLLDELQAQEKAVDILYGKADQAAADAASSPEKPWAKVQEAKRLEGALVQSLKDVYVELGKEKQALPLLQQVEAEKRTADMDLEKDEEATHSLEKKFSVILEDAINGMNGVMRGDRKASTKTPSVRLTSSSTLSTDTTTVRPTTTTTTMQPTTTTTTMPSTTDQSPSVSSLPSSPKPSVRSPTRTGSTTSASDTSAGRSKDEVIQMMESLKQKANQVIGLRKGMHRMMTAIFDVATVMNKEKNVL